MRFFYKRSKLFIGSKMRINLCIVCRVILVIRLRFHNRIQIDSIDTQFFQVGQTHPDPGKIAAEPLCICHLSASPRDNVLCIFFGGSVAEPIREDLIPHGLIDPPRCPINIRRIHPRYNEALKHPSIHLHLFLCQESIFKVIPDLLFCL